MKTIRFAHLDSAMRIVWEPDRTAVTEDEAEEQPLAQADREQPPREVRPDARAGEKRAGGARSR